jgi:hypothetical protein
MLQKTANKLYKQMILNYKNDIMAECLLSSTAIYTKVFCSLINTD